MTLYDFLDSQPFYELMQAYRHAPACEQSSVLAAFERVKAEIVLAAASVPCAAAPADFFERERPSLRLHIDDWHLLYGILLEKTSHDVDEGFYALRDRFADELARATGAGARDEETETADSRASDARSTARDGETERSHSPSAGRQETAEPAPPGAVARDPHRLLESLRETLADIVTDGAGQPIGRLLWRVKLCREQIDARLRGEAAVRVENRQ